MSIFTKKSNESNYEKRKKAIGKVIKNISKITLKEINILSKKHPNMPFYQNVKDKEEFALRNKISGLVALMAMDYHGNFSEDCKKIIEYANKGLKINPDSDYLLYFRGRTKGDLGQFEEGIEDLNKCLKLNPNYADAFIERGKIKQKLKDFSGAKNDFEKGIGLEPEFQQQVNGYLSENTNHDENMIIPSGITFKFIVTPCLNEEHQKWLKYVIIKNSGLDKYFKPIYVTFDDCYKGNNVSDDKFKGKQMLIKVFCPEPIVTVEKNEENNFYESLESEVSNWAINLIQSNTEIKYKVKLEAFLFTRKIENDI